MGDALDAILRYTHIITAVMWVGGIFLWSMLIAPTITRRAPPQAAGPVMRALVPRITRYMSIAGIVAILSGVALIYSIWGDFRTGFETPTGGYGIAMTLGLLGAVVMMLVAIFYIMPSAKKMLAIPPPAPGAAPSPEIPALQKRLVIGGSVNMLLGTLVLVTMVWAVNVFR